MTTLHTLTSAHPGELLSLEGRVALVSGGTGGIGSAVVARLLAVGAHVVSVDVDEDTATRDGVQHECCDVSDPEAVRRLVERVAQQNGRLDLLVHAAGITRDAVLWKLPDEDWSRVMAVNLDSGFHLLKAAAPWLRASPDAAVVLIASINGERGKFGQSNYAASKAGLIALAKTAAQELGAFGVRVNCVAPGFITTAMTAGLPAEVHQRAVDETALNRKGDPDDVARAVLFLCSAMARHVTGQVLRVDGGQLMA